LSKIARKKFYILKYKISKRDIEGFGLIEGNIDSTHAELR